MDNERVENVELADGERDGAAAFFLSALVSLVALLELDDCVHDANAARCNGKQPWRVSLSLQASGYNSIRKMIKRHTSINGSASVVLEL